MQHCCISDTRSLTNEKSSRLVEYQQYWSCSHSSYYHRVSTRIKVFIYWVTKEFSQLILQTRFGRNKLIISHLKLWQSMSLSCCPKINKWRKDSSFATHKHCHNVFPSNKNNIIYHLFANITISHYFSCLPTLVTHLILCKGTELTRKLSNSFVHKIK